MKTRHLIFIIAALMIGPGLFLYNSKPAIKNYPGSTLIFKKYYPENEISGMANDKSWREVRSSKDTLEQINHWFDQEYSDDKLVENTSDAHCTRKTWQQGETMTQRAIICDHGSYRTVLTIVPQL